MAVFRSTLRHLAAAAFLFFFASSLSAQPPTNKSEVEVRRAEPVQAKPEPQAAPAVDVNRTQVNNAAITEPYVALTFDDGPHRVNTPRLLDILKEHNVRATFYVVGRLVNEYSEIMRRIVAEGHEVANHSWSHPYLTRLSSSSARSQLARTHDAIVNTTGEIPRTMRPPYGAINSRLRSMAHDEWGYRTLMWSVDTLDWKRPGSSVVARRMINGAAPGAIILAHDIHEPTVRAIPEAIRGIKARGFKFATVTELLEMEKRQAALPEERDLAATEAGNLLPPSKNASENPTPPSTPGLDRGEHLR